MDRRELLKMITVLTGTAVVGGDIFLSGCRPKTASYLEDVSPIITDTSTGLPRLLTAEDVALLNEIGDTILPVTADSGGAKEANVGEFMNNTVTDCYRKHEQDAFVAGLKTIREKCLADMKKNFAELTPEERTKFIGMLEKEAKPFNQGLDVEEKVKRESLKSENDSRPWKDNKEFVPAARHYYTMIKQMTIMGYFTSEIGMTKARRHVAVPGKYDGALAYNKGDKAWAE